MWPRRRTRVAPRFALPALRLVEFPLQPFFVSWLDALGFGSCQSALKPGIPGAPPPGPHAKATEWYRHVKTSATAAETMSFVATTRSPALASNRSTGLSMYGPMALDQDQQSEIASLRSRPWTERSKPQRVASEKAALVEERNQRGSVSEELDA
jgi:hypothetical protein